MVEVAYWLCGLVVFWSLWWFDRKHIDRYLVYLCAALGLGYRKTYAVSVLLLLVAVFIYYGVLMAR